MIEQSAKSCAFRVSLSQPRGGTASWYSGVSAASFGKSIALLTSLAINDIHERPDHQCPCICSLKLKFRKISRRSGLALFGIVGAPGTRELTYVWDSQELETSL